MATVTGLTAERMLEIEAASVVDGDVVGGELILTKHDGTQINAGSVVGPVGPAGPIGSDLDVLMEQIINDVGMPGQIRAGREFMLMDFEHLGLGVPTALWNLSDFDDMSGNNRHLTEKGSISQTWGINGLADTAVQFNGTTTDALYIPDTGVGDPFRLRVGSFAAWVRTSKQGVYQSILTKRSAVAGQLGYWLRINSGNSASFGYSSTGSDVLELAGLTKICDDRWHFIVGTFDGALQELYVDGVLEASALRTSLIFASSGPLNIGAYGADAVTAGGEPHFGRADEVFLTPEVLTQERIHNLYCARIPHTLGSIPSGVSLNIHPGCKGASLVPADFPAAYQPLRLYNFSAGSLANEGEDGSGPLTMVGSAVSVAGVDGSMNNAYNFSGTPRLTSTDAGLPAGTSTVTYGCWVKTGNGTATMYVLTWGTVNGTNDTRIYIQAGEIYMGSGSSFVKGPFIADGRWHFVAVVQNNSAADGVKRKLYLDGRVVATSTVLNPITLGGSGKFVIGSSLASSNNLNGQVDGVFVVDVDLTFEELVELYIKTLHDHMPSPKNAGDHVESVDEDSMLVTFDTLPIEYRVNLKVMS